MDPCCEGIAEAEGGGVVLRAPEHAEEAREFLADLSAGVIYQLRKEACGRAEAAVKQFEGLADAGVPNPLFQPGERERMVNRLAASELPKMRMRALWQLVNFAVHGRM